MLEPKTDSLVPERAYGCLPDDDQGLLQFKGHVPCALSLLQIEEDSDIKMVILLYRNILAFHITSYYFSVIISINLRWRVGGGPST